MIERLELPDLAIGAFSSGVVLYDDEVIPILEPGAIAGAWSVGDTSRLGFTDLQQSALREIANIGSGHAATALSQLLGRPVEISYSEALLTVLAEAIDRIGAPMSRSALVDTPIQADGGTVLLVFPDDTGEQLCQLLGTTMADEIGLTALQEVGNILATSYLNAIVEMTGMDARARAPDRRGRPPRHAALPERRERREPRRPDRPDALADDGRGLDREVLVPVRPADRLGRDAARPARRR